MLFLTTPKGIKIKIPENSELIKIKNIQIIGRIRKDYGDIPALAQTMIDIGLTSPIDISPKRKLEDGGRRIKAFQYLGLTAIPFVIFDTNDIMSVEFIANAARKNFTTKETATIINRIERTRIGHRLKKGSKLPPYMKGKTVDVVAKITGKSPRHIQKLKDVVAAAKKEPKYEKFLEDVDKGIKSLDTAHKLVTIKERNFPKVKPPKGKADLLQVDWPYKFDNKTIRGGALHHYPLMSLNDICSFKLPITDQAVVAQWIPNSMKYDRVFYRGIIDSTMNHILLAHDLVVGTEIIWKKDKPAPGHYSLGYHETYLICFRGKKIVPVKRFPSVIEAPVQEHSIKPKIFGQNLLKMYPKRKAKELFAIEPSKGFKPWGNQVRQQSK